MWTMDYEIHSQAQETTKFLWGQRLFPLCSPDGTQVLQSIRELERRPDDGATKTDAGQFPKVAGKLVRKQGGDAAQARPASIRDLTAATFRAWRIELASPTINESGELQKYTVEFKATRNNNDNTAQSTTSPSAEGLYRLDTHQNRHAPVPPTTKEAHKPVPQQDHRRWEICARPSMGGVIVQLGGAKVERVRDPYINAEDAYCRKLMVFGARYIDNENRVWVCRQEDRFGYWDRSPLRGRIDTTYID